MRILADNKIPFLKGTFEPYAEVDYLSGVKISKTDLLKTDALVIRTRTQCTPELLGNSSVKFIGTATIGFDHIDTQYCDSNGIEWTNAPGCNADSVEQYLTAALLYWARYYNKELKKLTIGIVGVGNVGSRVARTCKLLEMKVLLNDPPRARQEKDQKFSDLEEICKSADIISLHVPLNQEGEDKTFHLIDQKFLQKVKPDTLIINTSRGEVIYTKDLLYAIRSNIIKAPIIDCWENEPKISPELLERSFLATPHIAGYSQDGKANGTKQIVRALSKHLDLPLNNWEPEGLPIPENKEIIIESKDKTQQEIITEAVLHTYPIWQDDQRLRESPGKFEEFRGGYWQRREYGAFTVVYEGVNIGIFNKFGFKNRKSSAKPSV